MTSLFTCTGLAITALIPCTGFAIPATPSLVLSVCATECRAIDQVLEGQIEAMSMSSHLSSSVSNLIMAARHLRLDV
ncbi:hypothetical protein B0J13DRAFT_558456 [Dactylonectria estremocensis]|uniref:Secreted protein n=1 Tax=Dactylonectria estremocensis TaxID=1079267 RepID=A0A9P9EHR1_9HYPO|nr:hypothetical protein B0J13DRAFT_558456 [Dactylonectria estremocensis]